MPNPFEGALAIEPKKFSSRLALRSKEHATGSTLSHCFLFNLVMSSTKFFRAFALITATVLCSQLAFAQFKVGLVNTDRLFNESKMAQQAQNRLKSEFSGREQEVVKLGKQLQEMGKKFERDFPTLSDSQKAERQKSMVELDQQFQVKRNSFQADLAKRRSEELKRVLDKANTVVKSIAEKENFDLILEDAVYVKPQYDITDRVLSSLNGS